jgi:SAM-dependent methyltransferase
MTNPAMSLKDRAYHDEIASSYDSTIVAPRVLTNDVVYRAIGRRIAPCFRTPLSSTSSMLDLGCGTGHLSCRFGRLFRNVVSVDHSEGMIAHARANIFAAGSPHAKLVACDGLSFIRSCQTGSFSLVGCVGFLHHLEASSIRDILSETHRVLVPGGFAIFQEPIKLHGNVPPKVISSWNSRSVVTRMQYTATLPHPDEEPIHLEDFISTLNQLGFQVDWVHRNWEIFPHSTPPRLLDRLATHLLNFLFGSSGNVCTILVRR